MPDRSHLELVDPGRGPTVVAGRPSDIRRPRPSLRNPQLRDPNERARAIVQIDGIVRCGCIGDARLCDSVNWWLRAPS